MCEGIMYEWNGTCEGVLVFEASYQKTGGISNMNGSQPLNASI